MERQFFVEGVQVFEEGTEEFFVEGVQISEDQEAAPAGGAFSIFDSPIITAAA
jgi:hypothetical protein